VRLDPRFRNAVYLTFFLLFVTGAAWVAADQLKDAPTAGEIWQLTAAYLLMTHGGGAMATLILLGVLIPVHIQRGWRGRRNRVAGAAMLACNALLVVTAFGLYYAGSEALRPWLSRIHIIIGFSLPVLWAVHVVAGRRALPGDRRT
jgi:hypothetical protein